MCAINFNVNMSVNSCNDLHTLLFKMSTKNDSKEISEKKTVKKCLILIVIVTKEHAVVLKEMAKVSYILCYTIFSFICFLIN